jgi:hypothetical protein
MPPHPLFPEDRMAYYAPRRCANAGATDNPDGSNTMTRSTLGRTAFSAAVALALGFGVREAVAAPAASEARRPYCRDDIHCETICETMYPGQPVGAFCSSGHTCYCYL